MGKTYTDVLLHSVFSTKRRQPLLEDLTIRNEMFRILADQLNKQGCLAYCVGGWIDHVHLFHRLSNTKTLASVINLTKTNSTKWMQRGKFTVNNFGWQTGYSSFSVSASNKAAVVRYIENQQQHHESRDFKDEMRMLYRKHGMKIDERFVWD